MNNLAMIIPMVLVISGILFWLMYPHRNTTDTSPAQLPPINNEGLQSPRHFRYFRQIRQALSPADTEYLLQNAPKSVAKQALRERRSVAQGFLKGLHEDFMNLSRLGRVVAALSPEISHRQEAERFRLTVKFQILYALVWLQLYTGILPIDQLERLTGLASRLAARIDEVMAEISAQSANQIAEKLGA